MLPLRRRRRRGSPAMANFSSHIQELRELIAASSTTTSTSAPASVHFEVKLREVLPNLLRDYVVPSSPTG